MNSDTARTGSTDPVGRELMRQAQLISQLRADLDQLAHTTTDIAADLLARCEDLEAGGSETGSPRSWCWRDLGPKATEELRSQLVEWVTWLRHRYPLAKKVPSCWSEHPEIVEEFTALWLAWQQAYTDANAPLTAAAEWHDHWLPGLLHRLEHGAFALSCSTEHTARPESSYA